MADWQLYQLFQILEMVIQARKRSLGQGNIFAPVCHYVHGGVSTWAGTPPGQVQPPGRYTPPGWVHPLGRYTLWQVHPPWAGTPRQVHPLDRYTPLAMHAGIRSTSGRYASYWNAFLFSDCFVAKLSFGHSDSNSSANGTCGKQNARFKELYCACRS